MKNIKIYLGLAIALSILAVGASAQNYKIKQSTSISGQSFESTVYVKSPRKRTESGGFMGMGADVATIEQCDLKRTVKVNDKKKMYFIEPFPTSSAEPVAASRPASPGKVTKGGTITMTSNVNDTGERKQMFGLTARHIKTSMKMESSPDACSKDNISMSTDGWYVDLPEFSCPFTLPTNPMAYQRQPRSGCEDKMITRQTGGGRLGFPLQVTTTMDGQDFTQSVETLEFSKATLEDSLFNVPTNYALAQNEGELNGKPDFSAMMKAGMSDEDEDKPKSKPSNSKTGPPMPMQTGQPDTKKPGTIRIGVLAPTNRGGENISITNMQSYLAQKLTTGNVEGVPVGSEADARSAGCDYLLTSDFSKLKQSAAGKIGGMFGKISNTGVGGSYDTQVDYTLTSLKSGQMKLQNKAAAKTETNVDRAAEGVLEIEAGAVVIAAIKN